MRRSIAGCRSRRSPRCSSTSARPSTETAARTPRSSPSTAGRRGSGFRGEMRGRSVPDLAVEVVSRHDVALELIEKIHEYFAAGVRLAWVVFPTVEQVYVYEIRDLDPRPRPRPGARRRRRAARLPPHPRRAVRARRGRGTLNRDRGQAEGSSPGGSGSSEPDSASDGAGSSGAGGSSEAGAASSASAFGSADSLGGRDLQAEAAEVLGGDRPGVDLGVHLQRGPERGTGRGGDSRPRAGRGRGCIPIRPAA